MKSTISSHVKTYITFTIITFTIIVDASIEIKELNKYPQKIYFFQLQSRLLLKIFRHVLALLRLLGAVKVNPSSTLWINIYRRYFPNIIFKFLESHARKIIVWATTYPFISLITFWALCLDHILLELQQCAAKAQYKLYHQYLRSPVFTLD